MYTVLMRTLSPLVFVLPALFAFGDLSLSAPSATKPGKATSHFANAQNQAAWVAAEQEIEASEDSEFAQEWVSSHVTASRLSPRQLSSVFFKTRPEWAPDGFSQSLGSRAPPYFL